MSKFHKSYRIRTEVGKDTQLHVKLEQEYDVLEIMSLEINQENAYKMHTSNYGVIAGRVLANGSFGIPNAKVSVFINVDNNDINDIINNILYPYNTTNDTNENGVRYNLLPNEQLNDCHTIIGTFPEKQYLLDNDNVLEIFDKYYKYTTRTNKSGDYMIFGVPTGSQTIHVDIDLSDIGILSQKPRDMVYKGYDINQFENPNKFKYDVNLNSLTQVITQDTIADVIPFWADEDENNIGITRCDIEIQYNFEPTCVFLGSVVSDNSSNGISKKCIPTPGMGVMEDLTTGSGTIEMIRKTPSGDVEEFQIQGTQLINGDGVWCYQIPMNLDYVMTDEFGNTVPTDDPNKGIPTRTKVRFRMSLQDFDNDNTNIFRCKVLVPHNPDVYSDKCEDELDYQFGTNTKDDSYRDLFWNGVYSVKSYIPRLQKGSNWKNEKFTGFKRVNYHGSNNPIPYNNIRIKIPFMYTVMCTLFKMIIVFVGLLNRLFRVISHSFVSQEDDDGNKVSGGYLTLDGEMCDDSLGYLCIIPGIDILQMAKKKKKKKTTMLGMTILRHFKELGGNVNLNSLNDDDVNMKDEQSIDVQNGPETNENGLELKSSYESVSDKNETKVYAKLWGVRVTDKTDYLINCIEMKLAEEYRVIQFDFYNDWINGVIYIPRWMRVITKKRKFLWGAISYGGKVKACNENYKNKRRNIVQQCGLTYDSSGVGNKLNIINSIGCKSSKKLRCHKAPSVRKKVGVFEQNGIVKSIETLQKQFVYYFKPYEKNKDNKNIRLFATDIILLGTLNECDKWGIPNDMTELYSSTYQMPPNLALTDSDTEGNDFYAKKENDKYIEFTINNKKDLVYDFVYDRLKDCYTGIGVMEDGGNYTEISGIDWGYEGPLQRSNNSSKTKFFKPGGHFLGMTCRNSETTIKTCVNLSRICEYGVFMSQRQTLNIPDRNISGKFLDYATVPTGLISKDEISETNYRRLFASMNKNRLRTVISKENGYPVYDFEYVSPTNFNGELYQFVSSEKDMNRRITNSVTEKYYEYTNDDYNERVSDGSVLVNETQIMRSGEYNDAEYFKYRFGLKDNHMTEADKRKRFLNNSSIKELSFPVYDNSFYFYFGLHDGSTALDEFKKNYYAKCEKMGSLTQIDNSILITDLDITYAGVVTGNSYESVSTGEIRFKIKTNNSIFGGGLKATLKDANDNIVKSGITISDANTIVVFDKLSNGTYNVEVTSESDSSIKEIFVVEVDMINLTADVIGVDFIKDVKGKSNTSIFSLDRNAYRGYIKFSDNKFKYYENSNGIDNDVFQSDYVTRVDIKVDNNVVIKNNDSNNKYLFNYNGIKKNAVATDDTKEYMIPVHAANTEYTVNIVTKIDNNGRLHSGGTKTHTWEVGRVIVNNAMPLEFLFNDISYNNILKEIETNSSNKVTTSKDSYTGWWANDVSGGTSFSATHINSVKWNLKKALYFETSATPHKIGISIAGGVSPYTDELTCMRESVSGDESNDGYLHTTTTVTGQTSSIIGNIKIPTINYISGGTGGDVRRHNFEFKAKDANLQEVPEDKKFVFPVIYKPFFTEMGIWYLNSDDKFYLHGNVYNGITWDYKNEGFNNVLLNDMKIVNAIGKLDHDDSYMAFNEPTIDTKWSGGYVNVSGINKDYFKYNGRKVQVDRLIEPTTYGLYVDKISPNVNITIGCSHNDNGTVYSNNTVAETDNGSGLTFFKHTFESKTISNNYYVKMSVTSGMDPNLYTTHMLDNSVYEYPTIVNGNLDISDKLFRHIMNNSVDNYVPPTGSIDSDGYFKIGESGLNGKTIYYVTVMDGGGGYNIEKKNTTSTNENNKIKAISISNKINLGSLSKFYPLNISSIYINDAWDDNLNSYKTTLFLTGGTDTFLDKRYDFTFMEKIGDESNNQYATLVTITFYSNSSTTVEYDLTSIRGLLKINQMEGNESGSSQKYIRIEFDAYSNGEKSPTAYILESVEIRHTDKPLDEGSV